MTRDPRLNPKPGDCIARDLAQAKAGTIMRDVTRAHGGFVFFKQDNGYRANNRIQTIEQWKKWAAKADVFEVALL